MAKVEDQQAQIKVPSIEERRLLLDERKQVLDERKQVLDESFPKKWGAVLFGAAATVVVSMITAASGWIVHNSNQTSKEIELGREEARRSADTARNALELYFKFYKPELDDKQNLYHLKIFAIIADNKAVSDVFREIRETALGQGIKDNRNNIADINAGLPVLNDTIGSVPTVPGDFTIYIQYPQLDGDNPFKQRAADLRNALHEAGFKVPAIDSVTNAPNRNEVRYYKASQKVLLGASLSAAARQLLPDSVDKILPNTALPNDTLEIWIGKNP